MQRERNGFTLIELLIVVAIIGVLAAIAIPNLLTAINRARQKRTMADMRSIGVAWEARAVDRGKYAAAGFSTGCDVPLSVADTRALLEPTFINPMPLLDGWKHEYEFAVNTDQSSYAIRSYGKHGQPDGTLTGGGTSALDCDILFSRGTFVQYPEGIQTQ